MRRFVVGCFHSAVMVGVLGATVVPPGDPRRVPIPLNDNGPASIAVDPGGTPHIVYQDDTGHVRHAWLSGGSWGDEPVEAAPASIGGSGFAADSMGRLHLPIHVLEGADSATPTWILAHAVREGSKWTRRNIEESTGFAALAIGVDDLPRILFQRKDGRLAIGRFDGAAWTVDDTGLQGAGVSLAFDATGHASAMVFSPGSHSYFATDASGRWVPFPGGVYFASVSMCLDSSGVNHFVGTHTTGWPDDRIEHVSWDGESWFGDYPGMVEKRDSDVYRYGSTLLCDGLDRLLAFYTDTYIHGRRATLLGRLAYRDGLGWRHLRLGAGAVHSAALAPDGAVHAILLDGETLRHLRIAFPDLRPLLDGLELSPDSDGVTVGGALRVVNQGTRRSARAKVRFYLSDDDDHDDEDEPVGRPVQVAALGPGGVADIPLRMAIAGPVGGKRLLAVLSTSPRRPDLDRRNNLVGIPLGE